MSTLQGRSIATTYKDLLQVSNNNIGVDGTIRAVEDGEGTQSALALSTDTIEIRGPIIPSTNATFDIGSAERKIRHLYLSSNSLYVGDLQFSEQDLQEVKNVRGGAYATSAQGALAETALQPGAFSFGDLSSKPTTLAGYGITDAATAAQGDAADAALAKANTALQPGGVRFTNDVTDKPTTLAGYGITDAFDGNFSSLQGTPTSLAGYGITDAATATQGDKADSALQPGDNIAFSNVTNTPTSLAGYGITDAATSAQGSLADTALQPGDSVSFSNITNTPVTLAGYGITNAATSTQGDKADTALQPDTEIHVNTVHLSGGKIFGPATMYIDPEAIGDNTGKLVILGDLQVDGVTTTVNSTTVSVSDKNFEIAKGATTSSQADGAGLLINPDISMLYQAITDSINFNKSVEVQGNLMLSDNSPEINLQTINPSHYNWRVAAQQIVDGGLEISVGDLDGNITDDTFDPLIVVKHTGNVGIGVTAPAYKLDVAGDINMTGALKVNGQDAVFSNWTNQNDGSISRASDVSVTGDVDVSGTMSVGEVFVMDNNGTLGGVTPTTVGQVVTWDGAKWIAADNAGGGGSSGPSEVPAAFSAALTQGQSVHTINFTKTYDTIPAVVTDLQITGDGDIIPYVITEVTTSSMTVTFASVIPNNNYKLNITFGGKDVFWNAGNLNTINYTDGNVGIGTTAPSAKLSINNGGAEGVEIQPGLSTDLNRITNFNRTTSTYNKLAIDASEIDLRASGSSVVKVSGSALTVNPDSLDYDFHVKPDTGVGMFVQGSSGNVGIGTTAPSSKFHIKGNGSAETKLTIDSGSSSHAACIGFSADNERAKILGGYDSGGGGFIKFNTDTAAGTATDRMIIDNEGHVGIGTTSPAASLDVANASNTEATSKFKNGGGSAPATVQIVESGSSSSHVGLFVGAEDLSSAVLMTKQNKVGIGTTNPEEMLHIQGTAPVIKLTDDNTNLSSLLYADTGMGGLLFIADSTSGGTDPFISFRIQGTGVSSEKMRITDAGNVGIGTTSPGQKLDVSGVVACDGLSIDKYTAYDAAIAPTIALGSSNADTVNTSQVYKYTFDLDGDATGHGLVINQKRRADTDRQVLAIGANGSVNVSNWLTSPYVNSIYHKAEELYQGGAVKWVQFYEREFTSVDSFGHGQFEFTILCNGATSGQSNTSRVLISTKQQSQSKRYNIKYVESICHNGGMPVEIGYTYDATGGQYGGGVLKVYAKPGSTNETYQRMAFHCRSNQTAASTNGLVKIADTQSGTAPAGLSIVTPDLCHASGGNINFGDNAGLYADQTLYNEGSKLFGSLGGQFGHIGMTLNIGSHTGMYTLHRFRNGNGTVGEIKIEGSTTYYNTSSDYRLKENVVPIDDAIQRVKLLKPSRFNFIADPGKTVDGFLAHEVQDVVPEAISGEKDGTEEEQREITPAVLDENGDVVTEAVTETVQVPVYQGIDQAKLVPVLTAAIQQQQSMIDELKAQNESLINRIETLENNS